jgi:hypothetical protein
VIYLALKVISNHAQAVTFTGNSSGTWGKPNPGENENPEYSGVSKNTLTGGCHSIRDRFK